MDKLTNELIASVAKSLDLEPALLKTVTVVECGNRDGFLDSGRPQILFEGHIMYKELQKEVPNVDIYGMAKRYPTLIHKNWTKQYYVGGEAEWKRLENARKINENAANKSASWGLGQIMGFNFALCGCKDVSEFVQKSCESHEMQLKLLYYFLYNTGLVKHLRNKDWDAFAKGYNGAGYKENAYDQKLRNAYENLKNKL